MVMSGDSQQEERAFQGIGVCPGAVAGPVEVLDRRELKIPSHRIAPEDVAGEIRRFQDALVRTREDLQEIQRELRRRIETGEEEIFDAHMMVLNDPSIIDDVVRLVETERINVEDAFARTADKYTSALEAMQDGFLQERAADVRDISHRVLSKLLGTTDSGALGDLREPAILLAHDLSPSVAAMFEREKVLGFAIDVGSPTSHTAILARSLRIPAVVGLRDASSRIGQGERILLDGYAGRVILRPGKGTLAEYGKVVQRHRDFEKELAALRPLPARTVDQETIHLLANLDHPDEACNVDRYGAEGVGLFRTEHLFLNCRRLPDEDEQFQAYAQVARALGDRPLTLRTLDLGTDKMSGALPPFEETNPALGVRAIRLCLHFEEMFRTQLRAILRASALGRLRILFPMIDNLDELDSALRLLGECRAELEERGVPFDPALPVGIMIETPAAAMITDILARRVDFMSIGTNDLIQYGAAVDRTNERVAHLYEPSHPGILRLIRNVAETAAQSGTPVSVCGEMAGYPVFVPLLVGLGLRHLSASAPSIPQLKYLIRKLHLSDTVALAEQALAAASGTEVVEACQALTRRMAIDLPASSLTA